MVFPKNEMVVRKLVQPKSLGRSALLLRQLNNIPGCGQACISAINPAPCSEADVQCQCMSVAYVSDVKVCLGRLCSVADYLTSYQSAAALCQSVGVDINTVTSSPAATTSTFSTASAVNSGSPATTSVAPQETANSASHKNSIGPIVGGVVGGVLGLALIGLLVYLCHRRGTRQRRNRALDLDDAPGVPAPVYADGPVNMTAKEFPESTPYAYVSPRPNLNAAQSDGNKITSSGLEDAALAVRREKGNQGDHQNLHVTNNAGGAGQEAPGGQDDMIHRIASTVAAMLRDDPRSGEAHVPPPSYAPGQAGVQ